MPIGGKLRLKGEKKKEKKEKSVGVKRSLEEDESSDVKLTTTTSDVPVETSSILTEAQKRHMAKKLKRESEKGAAEIIKTTYRERVENFNMKLSTLTEHNDIPRVSAAGNG
jgi:protein FAM32A